MKRKKLDKGVLRDIRISWINTVAVFGVPVFIVLMIVSMVKASIVMTGACSVVLVILCIVITE